MYKLLACLKNIFCAEEPIYNNLTEVIVESDSSDDVVEYTLISLINEMNSAESIFEQKETFRDIINYASFYIDILSDDVRSTIKSKIIFMKIHHPEIFNDLSMQTVRFVNLIYF